MTPRTEQYITLRKQGLTYREIAAQLGVTYQAVAQVCAKRSDTQFRKILPDGCVYPVLRDWMNEHRVSRQELYRLMNNGEPCIGKAPHIIANRLRGESGWKMDEINKLLDITGMTYEELFRS